MMQLLQRHQRLRSIRPTVRKIQKVKEGSGKEGIMFCKKSGGELVTCVNIYEATGATSLHQSLHRCIIACKQPTTHNIYVHKRT